MADSAMLTMILSTTETRKAPKTVVTFICMKEHIQWQEPQGWDYFCVEDVGP